MMDVALSLPIVRYHGGSPIPTVSNIPAFEVCDNNDDEFRSFDLASM
jgi:hypothetical protein